jgi:hypothetical protein
VTHLRYRRPCGGGHYLQPFGTPHFMVLPNGAIVAVLPVTFGCSPAAATPPGRRGHTDSWAWRRLKSFSVTRVPM